MGKLTCCVVGLPMFLFGIGNNVTVHFSVHDDGGNAVTNAEIKARTRRDRLEFWTHASTPMRETIVQTDTLGGATACFPCYSGDFDCLVSAPGFYSEVFRDIHFRIRGDSVGYARLLEHEKDVSLTLRRKRNPVPMYVSPPLFDFYPPSNSGSFGFDLKKLDWVSPYGTGEVTDFELVCSYSKSNNYVRSSGCIVFNTPLSGAYKLKKTHSKEFQSVYTADTNGIYQQRFEYVIDAPPIGRFVRNDILRKDEYLVLRTRTKVDAHGHLVSAHYAKIYGAFFVGPMMCFEYSFFNPTPNDPNLEYNGENLAPRRR